VENTDGGPSLIYIFVAIKIWYEETTEVLGFNFFIYSREIC